MNTEETKERTRLRNSPEQSVTWLYLGDDGRLIVEWYDYSDQAQEQTGNDVAYLLYIDDAAKRQIWSSLADPSLPTEAQTDQTLIDLMAAHFDNYHQVKQWFIDKNIPFETRFDGWA